MKESRYRAMCERLSATYEAADKGQREASFVAIISRVSWLQAVMADGALAKDAAFLRADRLGLGDWAFALVSLAADYHQPGLVYPCSSIPPLLTQFLDRVEDGEDAETVAKSINPSWPYALGVLQAQREINDVGLSKWAARPLKDDPPSQHEPEEIGG